MSNNISNLILPQSLVHQIDGPTTSENVLHNFGKLVLPKCLAHLNGDKTDTNLDKPIGMSLFSGTDGFALGFEQAGCHMIGGIDYEPHAVEMSKLNFPHSDVRLGDLSKLTGKQLLKMFNLIKRQLNFIIAGPPCPPFSLEGKRDLFDELARLYIRTFRIIYEMEPDFGFIETVLGILLGDFHEHFWPLVEEEMERLSDKYIFKVKIMNSAHYQVGQSRNRVIVQMVHRSLGIEPEFPAADLDGWKKMRICDLLPGVDGVQFGRGKKNIRSKYQLIPTFTKTANVWPIRNGELGQFTVEEMLKISGFPADFKVTGSINQIRERLGNAVMPPFAKALATKMIELYFLSHQRKTENITPGGIILP